MLECGALRRKVCHHSVVAVRRVRVAEDPLEHISEFFRQGGFFMYVNLVSSAIAIALIVERTIFFLGKGSVNAQAFLEQIRKLVAANNVDRAIKLCSATEAPGLRLASGAIRETVAAALPLDEAHPAASPGVDGKAIHRPPVAFSRRVAGALMD